MMDSQTIERFATMHEGGSLATVKDQVRPMYAEAKGDDYLSKISDHLLGDVPIGVYPLWERNNVWMVDWVAVDLDEGDISGVHADNLQALLKQMNITSWKEPSKSKGYHVWVYLKDPISASIGRKAMIGACRVVDVPIKEVYPKQTSLGEGKLGNCLRLPYPNIRNTGRQEVEGYTLKAFVDEAWDNLTHLATFKKLLPLYEATEPVKKVQFTAGARINGEFVGVAKRIWEEGNVSEDRSEALYAFASSLLWQEFSIDATVDWTRKLDDRIGKFKDRPDRDKQIRNLVERASQKVRRA
tara:strand:+ start:3773 stop:4666 length:894 start_codon:yes stop_codon:yes gene_type:complete